ncbi:hypothetical protein BHE74_00052139 [Ensete ventricosum]|nr:hypothetical protein BHE74_00052139 [Ensete ventricosum]RZS14091.1 hypothetical protein BHM03_00045751 [Ensete ventricosum]
MAAVGVCSYAREKLSENCSLLCPGLSDRGTTCFSQKDPVFVGFFVGLVGKVLGLFAASIYSCGLKAVIVLLHITFVGVIFLFDANLIRKSREEPWNRVVPNIAVLCRTAIGMGCTELYRAMLTHGTWGILMYRPYRFPVGLVLSRLESDGLTGLLTSFGPNHWPKC